MILTIPYNYTPITINTSANGDLKIVIGTNPKIVQLIFDQLLYNMSYDDLINAITPQSFEQIMKHYQTEYKEE